MAYSNKPFGGNLEAKNEEFAARFEGVGVLHDSYLGDVPVSSEADSTSHV